MKKRQRKKNEKKELAENPHFSFHPHFHSGGFIIPKNRSRSFWVFLHGEHKIPFLSISHNSYPLQNFWISSNEEIGTIFQVKRQEVQMTLQNLIDSINQHRKKVGLNPIFIHSRPSSSGEGKTLEVRCWGNNEIRYPSSQEILEHSILLSKSVHAGSLNWFLKGMLSAFQSKTAPVISGNFSEQIHQITRSNYSRIVEEG